MKFLNCNYPQSCKIPKGKPKCLKTKMLQIKYNGATLIEQKRGTIWFVNDGYYWGIELDIKRNFMAMIDEFTTVGKTNIALLKWDEVTLSNENEDLLYKYLKMIG